MATPAITIEIAPGPTLRTALDVLDLAVELVDAIPDYDPRRQELITRAVALRDQCIADLNA